MKLCCSLCTNSLFRNLYANRQLSEPPSIPHGAGAGSSSPPTRRKSPECNKKYSEFERSLDSSTARTKSPTSPKSPASGSDLPPFERSASERAPGKAAGGSGIIKGFLNAEQATQRGKLLRQKRDSLPIFSHKEKLLKHIKEHQVRFSFRLSNFDFCFCSILFYHFDKLYFFAF